MEGGWWVDRRGRTWGDLLPFANCVVPSTEMRKPKISTRWKKNGKFTAPEPLTSPFRASGDKELKESKRKIQQPGCSLRKLRNR